MNLLLIFTFYYKYLNIEKYFNLRIKTVLYLKYNRINGFVEIKKRKSGTASLNTDSHWSKHEARFAGTTRVWLAVNYITSVTSGE